MLAVSQSAPFLRLNVKCVLLNTWCSITAHGSPPSHPCNRSCQSCKSCLLSCHVPSWGLLVGCFVFRATGPDNKQHGERLRASGQVALEAVYNYLPKLPPGEELSAVSLSWGKDEVRTSQEEADACDKWIKALLDKVASPTCS